MTQPDQVWVVYEPQDYQQARILGVYRYHGDALDAWVDARTREQAEGNVNWSYIALTPIVLE